MGMMRLDVMKELLEDIYQSLKRQEELGLSALDGDFSVLDGPWFFESESTRNRAEQSPTTNDYASPQEALSQLRAVLEMPKEPVRDPGRRGPAHAIPSPTHISKVEPDPRGSTVCLRCGEEVTREAAVYGRGLDGAALMFLGDGLGSGDAKRSNPFVGEVGELLKNMIRAMGLSRNQVYLTTMPACQPSKNGSPDVESACYAHLDERIKRVSPQVIVTLGQATSQAFLERSESIVDLRGTFVQRRGITVMPTYHPAYLLKVKEAKKLVWADLQLVMAKLGLKRR